MLQYIQSQVVNIVWDFLLSADAENEVNEGESTKTLKSQSL